MILYKKNTAPPQRALLRLTRLLNLHKNWAILLLSISAIEVSAIANTPTPSLITNGGFEEDFVQGQPPGFRCSTIDSQAKATATFKLIDDAFSNKKALSITRTNTDSGYALWVKIPTIASNTPPRRVVFVYRIKTVNSDGTLSGAYLTWEGFTPEWYGACKCIRAVDPDPYVGTWGKGALLLEQIPGKTLQHFRFRINARKPGDTILFDNIAFYDVTEWPEKAVNALMRREQQPVAKEVIDKLPFRRGNILHNSSFELGLSGGWSIPGPNPQQQMLMIDSSTAHHGKHSVRLDYEADKRVTLTGRFLPVRINQTHTLSAWVRSTSPGTTVTLRFENGYVPSDRGPHAFDEYKLITPGEWQRMQVSGVTKAGPANAYAIKISVTGPEDGSLFIDSVQFEEGTASNYAPRKPLEVALMPHTTAGISLWDQPMHYLIKAVNHTAEPIESQLKILTFDFNNQQVDSLIPDQISFPPGLTSIDHSEAPKVRGAQRLRIYINEQPAVEDEISLSIIPPIRYPDGNPESRFGQHVKLNPWELNIARQMGAGWIRMHDVDFCLSWDNAEPEQGRWVWADDKIDRARANKLEILGVLGRTPGWILPADKSGKPARGGWVYPPDLQAWGTYVENVTRHYKDKIQVWEIWNEPYSFGVYDGTKYAALAKVAYAAAKRGNPESRILGFCTHAGATAFNRDALAGGAMHACDSISYHYYSKYGFDAYERATAVRKALGLTEDEKVVWMTEGIGGYTYSWHSLLSDAVDDHYSRKPAAPKFTAELAAITGARAIANILSTGVEKLFWYWSPWETASSIRPDRYSWFEYDGQLKPHAAAFAVAAHFLDGAHPAKRTLIEERIVTCIFQRNSDSIAVVWREDDKTSLIPLPISPEKPIQIYDLMGNPPSPKAREIQIGTQPLYIQAPAINPEKLESILRSVFSTN